MAEYDMGDLFEDVVLKIGDHRFKLRERTISLSAKAEPLAQQLDEIPDDADDQVGAALLIELIDVLLEPLGDGNGTRSHAKTVLSKAYKNEEIGVDRLMAITEFLQEKFSDRRPTSAATSG